MRAIRRQRNPHIRHVVTWFAKGGDEPLGTIPLVGWTPAKLRRLLQLPKSDPVFASFPIGPDQAAQLRDGVRHRFDMKQFDYFIECEAVAKRPIGPSGPGRRRSPGVIGSSHL